MVVQRRGTDTDTDTDTEAREPKSQAAEEILSIFKNQKKILVGSREKKGSSQGRTPSQSNEDLVAGVGGSCVVGRRTIN